MKYLAILFMCNDEKRAEFVIENFKKHNPEIPLIVYNGGNSVKHYQDKYDIELIEGPNLWHKKTHCRIGSFGYDWFEFLFSAYKSYKPEYLIFLETDVKVNKKIEIEPEYDISGVCIGCGPLERIMSYYYWGDYLKGKDFFSMNNCDNWDHKFHTGMGGTVFSRNFFEKCEKNLHLVKECYDLIPFCCYADLTITLLSRYSGCSMGDWKETSDTRGTHRIVNGKWITESLNMKCALIHNYKI
jgi:hypothetical protein